MMLQPVRFSGSWEVSPTDFSNADTPAAEAKATLESYRRAFQAHDAEIKALPDSVRLSGARTRVMVSMASQDAVQNIFEETYRPDIYFFLETTVIKPQQQRTGLAKFIKGEYVPDKIVTRTPEELVRMAIDTAKEYAAEFGAR